MWPIQLAFVVECSFHLSLCVTLLLRVKLDWRYVWTWCSWFRNSWQDFPSQVESSWNVMAHGDAREGKWRGNWQMKWVASTLHTTSEHGVSSITTADAHTSAASSRLNGRSSRFKRACPFRRKTKSGFCAYAITFQTQSNTNLVNQLLGWLQIVN
jgi:hypothetical protein